MPVKLESYFAGSWHAGKGQGRPFYNPVTQDVLGYVDSTGIDLTLAFEHAQTVGLNELAALSFSQRGLVLKSIADVLSANREKYVDIARLNSGNTDTDAAIDIDGGIGVLKFYARLAERLGSAKHIIEPGQDQLAREPVFFSRHLWSTRPGVALQINAFNFPSWGMWEKIAVALLAGVPSIAKPASATAWLSAEMARDVFAASVVPAGAIGLVCGQSAPLIECLTASDSLAFTGSSETALSIKRSEPILTCGVRVNIEADSLNATVVGPDTRAGTPVFELAVREITKALTVKAGQFCTNIRRVFVPRALLPEIQEAVATELSKIKIGDPADKSVRVGPLVNSEQRDAALAGIAKLRAETEVVCGGKRPQNFSENAWSQGAFVAPTLLRCDKPVDATAVHQVEVFGPCATLMPYTSVQDALHLAARGRGSLVASVFTNDATAAAEAVATLAPWHGRLLVVDETVGKNHTGHAIVMPQCVHGGPGRAGSGEEQGGLRALRFHMQRSAIQTSPNLLAAIDRTATESTL